MLMSVFIRQSEQCCYLPVDLSLPNLAFTFHSSFYSDLYFLVTVELCLNAKFKSHPCPHCLRKSLGIFHNSCTTAAQTDNSRDIPLGMELIAASDNITNAILFVQPWGEVWKNRVLTKPQQQLIPGAQLFHRITEKRGPADPSPGWPKGSQEQSPALSRTTSTAPWKVSGAFKINLSPLLVLKLQNKIWGVKEKPLSSAPPESQLRAHHTQNAILLLLGALLSAVHKKSLYNRLRKGHSKSISSCKIKSWMNWRKASRQHWCQVALACSGIWA